MIRALLLDLDGTLLDVEMRALLREYLSLLSEHLDPLVPADQVAAHVLASTHVMGQNADPDQDNLTVFWREFCARTGCDLDPIRDAFDRFYAERFDLLRHHTRPNPAARPLVEWALAQGLAVAIATQPVFPLSAIRHRLRWAGLDDFRFAVITTCEVMHACKPSPHYFRELLHLMGRRPEECLMVGDDVEMDLPARDVGIRTHLITPAGAAPAALADSYGPLEAVRDVLERLGGSA